LPDYFGVPPPQPRFMCFFTHVLRPDPVDLHFSRPSAFLGSVSSSWSVRPVSPPPPIRPTNDEKKIGFISRAFRVFVSPEPGKCPQLFCGSSQGMLLSKAQHSPFHSEVKDFQHFPAETGASLPRLFLEVAAHGTIFSLTSSSMERFLADLKTDLGTLPREVIGSLSDPIFFTVRTMRDFVFAARCLASFYPFERVTHGSFLRKGYHLPGGSFSGLFLPVCCWMLVELPIVGFSLPIFNPDFSNSGCPPFFGGSLFL